MADSADSLPAEQRASYSAIIDDILAGSDLNTISAKAIRKQLQEKVEYDIGPQKKAITELIMDRFDKAQAKQGPNGSHAATGTGHKPFVAPRTNGAAQGDGISAEEAEHNEADEVSAPTSTKKRKADQEDDEDDLSVVEDSSPAPKKKKTTKHKMAEDETDEQLAARLQAELNAVRARQTRGGNAKKRAPVKKEKKSKKKSSAKIKPDDDSELDTEDGDKPEKEKKGGFHKPMNLSEPLAALLGETQLSRPQTVKRIWAYVKERDLQEPTDKRNILCDELLRAVFKSEKVHMFTMNKILANHLYPVDETV